MDIMWTQSNGMITEFPHLEMLGRMTVRKLGAMSLAQHQNPGIEICYIDKGRFDWTVEGRPVLALPGMTSVTFPWQQHGGTRAVMDIGKLVWLVLKPEKFTPSGTLQLGPWSMLPTEEQAYISKQLLSAPQPLVLSEQTTVRNCFREIFTEFSAQHAGRQWRVNRLLDDLLLLLARSIERSAIDSRRTDFDVGWIEKAVRAEPGKKWTLNDLCKLSGWGKTALNPRIKAATGYSTMEYVLALRLALSQDRLIETTQSITDIALAFGFSSSQHFSMAFRQRVGMSPSKFRESHSSSAPKTPLSVRLLTESPPRPPV